MAEEVCTTETSVYSNETTMLYISERYYLLHSTGPESVERFRIWYVCFKNIHYTRNLCMSQDSISTHFCYYSKCNINLKLKLSDFRGR
jgi:hypothetical protein